MPFGLSNGAAVFKELKPVVLQGLWDFAKAYLNDTWFLVQCWKISWNIWT